MAEDESVELGEKGFYPKGFGTEYGRSRCFKGEHDFVMDGRCAHCEQRFDKKDASTVDPAFPFLGFCPRDGGC